MQDHVNATPTSHKRVPWNKVKVTGAKPGGLAVLGWTKGFFGTLAATHESYLDLPAHGQP
jgi:hypothetical protein